MDMSIKYFYNFCLTGQDDIDLEGDILSAVRKSYFSEFHKIRDKITYDSEGDSLSYEYCIEKDKPLKWLVKTQNGEIRQEVLTSDNGRYYLCFYRDQRLFKRMLFSKLHTLLKVEYIDEIGVVDASLEPRKVQGGLCLLYTGRALQEPVVLYEMPDVSDERVAMRLYESYRDYTAAASTDGGIVWFLTDEQTAHFKETVALYEEELIDVEESFVGDETPLFDKINPKDFNIKRNLSSALDISDAKVFGAEAVEEEPVEDDEVLPLEEETVTENADDSLPVEPEVDEEPEEVEEDGAKPDKLIMADGVVYSYYGELDENDNRNGYGRTVTDLGKTAYEGMYLHDKRSGKGAYFYKDGTLCYSGDWSENVRHGVGVGISAKDGSMHIGRWKNNKPEGNGVRLSAEGDIRFVCKELEDGDTVLMHYMPDDTVLISKYDKNGKKIAEKTVSLLDFE